MSTSDKSDKCEINNALIKMINNMWLSCYEGEFVTDLKSLQHRCNMIVKDRQCWISNAKANQKYYQRLLKDNKHLLDRQEIYQSLCRDNNITINGIKVEDILELKEREEIDWKNLPEIKNKLLDK